MNKKLQQQLEKYQKTLSQSARPVQSIAKLGLSGAAAMAAVLSTPVELSSQTVCGNLGAPTRTAGSCIGGPGNIGTFATNYCAKFDFDGDGTNELQIRYYNYNGVYPGASFYVDPLQGSQLWTINIDTYFGLANFPAPAVANYGQYIIQYAEKIFIVPLSSGSGFGFVALDPRVYTFANGNHAGAHPITGQPICCWGYGEVVLWGASTGITIGDFLAISSDMTDCGNVSPVLPVEFTEFAAIAKEDQIDLNWVTASETNNSGFEVERSADGGQRFEKLGFVTGAGDSRQEKQYSFTDETARPGQEYVYRLKQIDFDGTYAYSKLATAELNKKGFRATLFPNPTAASNISLQLEGATNSVMNIGVYKATGQPLHQQEQDLAAGSSQLSLNLDLSPGLYFVKLEQAGTVKYERLIIE